MNEKMNQIDVMFQHEGKTSKLIGTQRLKAYEATYNHVTKMQDENKYINEKLT